MVRNPIFLLVIGFAIPALSQSAAQEPFSSVSSIALPHIIRDIRELSHPRYQGRQTGTKGGQQATHYVLNRLKTLGLVPGHSLTASTKERDWFQQQSIQAIRLSAPATMSLFPLHPNHTSSTIELELMRDFLPVLDSPSSTLRAPVVFVGYGIVDPARDIDPYNGVDVHNRIVLFLRGKPPSYTQWVTHEEKAAIAKERGAAGYFTVTGPLLDRYEARKGLRQIPLAIYAGSPHDRPLPGAWIHGKTLDRMLQFQHESLEALQRSANDVQNFQGRPLPLLADFYWESRTEVGSLINIIGMIPGHHPLLRDEIILIGAHRDHFGQQAGLLFPGADDNASGTAVMLELARLFSQKAKPLSRTIVFVSFDGEERGLLGSRYYVNNPARPLTRTKAMINLDHLGVGNGNLTVGVTRMETALVQQVVDRSGLSRRVQIYGFFPGGDHVPFYEAGVPTITVASSGTHPHFHQPSDTTESLQPEILETAGRFLLTLVSRLADEAELP